MLAAQDPERAIGEHTPLVGTGIKAPSAGGAPMVAYHRPADLMEPGHRVPHGVGGMRAVDPGGILRTGAVDLLALHDEACRRRLLGIEIAKRVQCDVEGSDVDEEPVSEAESEENSDVENSSDEVMRKIIDLNDQWGVTHPGYQGSYFLEYIEYFHHEHQIKIKEILKKKDSF